MLYDPRTGALARRLLPLGLALGLAGCNTEQTQLSREYSPTDPSMSVPRAREILQATLTSGASLEDGGVVTDRINDVRVRSDAVAVMYQPKTSGGYGPSTIQTCYFAAVDPSIYRAVTMRHAPGTWIATGGNVADDYQVGRTKWRVNLCKMGIVFDDPSGARRLSQALYTLSSSRR